MGLTTVKVCGVRDAQTATFCFSVGVDYVGLVLAKSRRQVTLAQAQDILAAVPGKFVAVVQDVTREQLEGLSLLPFAGIQVHDSAPNDWTEIIHRQGQLAIATWLHPAADIALLDGEKPGSGIARRWHKPSWPHPIWLAGGLNPRNVRRVVRELAPEGVDVSSGVESEGTKQWNLIEQFVKEVHHGNDETRA